MWWTWRNCGNVEEYGRGEAGRVESSGGDGMKRVEVVAMELVVV